MNDTEDKVKSKKSKLEIVATIFLIVFFIGVMSTTIIITNGILDMREDKAHSAEQKK